MATKIAVAAGAILLAFVVNRMMKLDTLLAA